MARPRFPMAMAIAATLIVALLALNVYQFLEAPGATPAPAPVTPGLGPNGLPWRGVTLARAAIDPDASPERQIIDRFHALAYEAQFGPYAPGGNPDQPGPGFEPNRWLGIVTLQNPNDVWITQEILSEVKPDFVVETGTRFGGSAALWAMVLEQVHPEGRVLTIDIEDQVTGARDLPIVRERVDFLVGSSTAPEIVAEVARRVAGKTVVVILDSDHSKAHVLNELRAYAPFVNPGSYLIVQDTNVNGHPVLRDYGPGPWEAVTEFLATDDRFEPDPGRERLLFTMHPRGYLRRKGEPSPGTSAGGEPRPEAAEGEKPNPETTKGEEPSPAAPDPERSAP